MTYEGSPGSPVPPDPLTAARFRAETAEAQAKALTDELTRTTRLWRLALIAVVAVALLAILMLGIVAFNAADDTKDALALLTSPGIA